MVVGNQAASTPAISRSVKPGAAGPTAADSGIEQQLDAARFDVDAVAVAAGLEGDDLHGRIVAGSGQTAEGLPSRSPPKGGTIESNEAQSMNKAFVREPDQTADYCPRCGSKGQQVGRETVQSYLPDGKTPTVADPANFCPSPQCDVVYFDAFERVMLTGDLSKPVYPKNPDAPDLCLFRADPARDRTGRKRRRCDPSESHA